MIRTICVRSAVVAAVLAALWLAVPVQLGGATSYVTTQGASMQPRFHTGDLAITRAAPSYRVGDVVAYRSAELRRVVMHRIVAIDGGRYTFKGDNNSWQDPERPTRSQLVGTLALRIPRGGIWLHRLTSPALLAAYTFLLLLGGGAASRTRRQRRKDLRTMSPRHRAHAGTTLRALPPSLYRLTAGAAALGVAGLALTGLAWSRPAQQAVAASSSATSSMRFSYAAAVPRSAAYDGMTVTAPQPVFRKLTDQVDVTYRYSGPPGALKATVELSTSSGWTTSIPIGEHQIGRTYDGTAKLDLAALQRRADAAAKATGVPRGDVSVTVLPRVALAGGGTFAPRFELSLTDTVLKPTGDLTAKRTTKITGSRVEPAQLAAFGHGISIAAARAAGPAALLLSLLAAAAIAALTRRSGPVAEAERIRARYGELILPVLPVVLAPGRPVVDVPDVDALARLAERYGLLVLHWSRGGVDTYVVQDEGTTYRYRNGRPVEAEVLV